MGVGDEFHYLFKCSHFNYIRKRLLNCFYSRAPNSLKFELLMNVQNEVNAKHFCGLCEMLDQRRRHWPGVVQMFCRCFVFAGNVIIL